MYDQNTAKLLTHLSINFFTVTLLIADYFCDSNLFSRLSVVERIPMGVSLLCTSVQFTKVGSLLLKMLPYTEINNEWKVICLFLLILQALKAFVFDSKFELPLYQVRDFYFYLNQ